MKREEKRVREGEEEIKRAMKREKKTVRESEEEEK